MSYPLTTSLNVIRELQWVKEVVRGTTPASPTFAAIPTTDFDPKVDVQNIKYRKLGSPDLYKGIKVREMYDFSINYSPVDSTLLKSMINLTGTGNRDDFFTFLLSQKQNNAGTLVEMYQILRGAGINDVSVAVKSGQLVTVSSNWISNSLSQWATTTGISGTPVFASPITLTPWSSTTTGASPLTFNGSSYDIENFTMKVSQNPDRVQVVGQSQTTWIQQTTRDITLDIEVVYQNNTISTDTINLTNRPMTMQLNSVGPTTLTFTDVYLEKYDENVSASSTSAKTVSYSGYAASVVIA